MRKSRFSEEQITMALRQGDAGTPVEEICRKMRSRAASNNQTITVDGSGRKHTSEQLVFPGLGYVYLREGHVETVQIQ